MAHIHAAKGFKLTPRRLLAGPSFACFAASLCQPEPPPDPLTGFGWRNTCTSPKGCSAHSPKKQALFPQSQAGRVHVGDRIHCKGSILASSQSSKRSKCFSSLQDHPIPQNKNRKLNSQILRRSSPQPRAEAIISDSEKLPASLDPPSSFMVPALLPALAAGLLLRVLAELVALAVQVRPNHWQPVL